jgi:iron complex outermembrane recepter protein
MQVTKRVLFFIIILCFFSIKAQPPSSIRSGMPAVYGKVYGKVLNAATKEPVVYATITMLTMRDSLVGGALVKNNGDFVVEKLPMGRYKLKVQFIGYTTLLQNVVLTPKQPDMDLGNLRLEQDAKQLSEVVIKGERQLVQTSIDKRVFNVDKDISSKGGTAVDVMKNLPGVTVDGEGNVNLRNGSPTIFIDGRPSVLSLEQIPAEQIDRIEIITNPSARFDASATNGILNVIMKKNTKPGYNGMLNAGIGTNNRYNAMLNLNIKEKKFNFFMSYNINSSGNINEGYTYRTNMTDEVPSSYFNQDNTTDQLRLMQMGRFGLDYNISNRDVITISQSFNQFIMNMTDEQSFSFEDNAEKPVSYGNRSTKQDVVRAGYTTQIQYKHNFPKPGKELLTDFTYNIGQRDANSHFVTTNYDLLGNLLPNNPEVQSNSGGDKSAIYTYQLDFVNPLSDSSKWEFGAKSNLRTDIAYLDVQLGIANNPLQRDSLLSNNYTINEFINGVYTNYSGVLNGFGYMAGLRFEQTNFKGELTDKGQTFEYIYPDGLNNLQYAFFPSLFLNRKINKNHEVQLNITRKINRPGWMQVMPFIMFADRQSYRIGNPNLAPEFINSMEANYSFNFDNGNYFTSAYAKITDNAITNYVYTYTDPVRNDPTILVSTFINGDKAYSYGWEHILKYSFFKRKMDVTLSGNIFYTQISATTLQNEVIKNEGFSWNGKFVLSYKLPFAFVFQTTASYEAPRIIPQGITIPVYFLDMSFAKDITKKLSMNLTLSDVFNTKRFGAVYDTESFTQDFSRRWESRYLRLTLSWRFGETDQSIFRRKNNQRRDRDSGGEEMGF